MNASTVLCTFGVVNATADEVLETEVRHYMDTLTGYDLITIAQVNADGATDVVCLSREQLLSIQSQVKGH